MYLIILLGMIFCHIIDDFYLQGILAQMKQKQWWVQNAPGNLYENDYKIALMFHAFSWVCSIHIPIVIHIAYCDWYYNTIAVLIIFIIDWLIHAIVDDLKANKKVINLVQDQTIHLIQIIATWFLYCKVVM